MEFIFKHLPIAQQRARVGKHGNFYNPQKIEIIKCRMDAMSQIGEEGRLIDLGSCVSLNMTIHTPFPKTFDSRSINEHLGNPDQRKPDLDNYLKFYMDALQGVAYHDDSNVTQIIAEKIFSKTPSTRIVIEPHIGSFIDQMHYFEKQNVLMHERLQRIYDFAMKKISSGNDPHDWEKIRSWAYKEILDEII